MPLLSSISMGDPFLGVKRADSTIAPAGVPSVLLVPQVMAGLPLITIRLIIFDCFVLSEIS
jgi:hypothetical protein